MRTSPFIFIICSVLIFMCGCKPQMPNEEQEFLDYLAYFDLSPEENHCYVFIPSTQCMNCVNLDASRLSPDQNERIYIFSNLAQKHFRNFRHYIHDKEDKVTSLKLVSLENKMVYFSKGKIVFCKAIDIVTL